MRDSAAAHSDALPATHPLAPEDRRQGKEDAPGEVAGDNDREGVKKVGRRLEALGEVALHHKVAVDVWVELAQVVASRLRAGLADVVLCEEEAGLGVGGGGGGGGGGEGRE